MSRVQTLVQLNERLLGLLDARAAREHRTRSDLIRAALDAYLAGDERARVSAAIVAGYQRVPQDDDLEGWSRVAGRETAADERW